MLMLLFFAFYLISALYGNNNTPPLPLPTYLLHQLNVSILMMYLVFDVGGLGGGSGR